MDARIGKEMTYRKLVSQSKYLNLLNGLKYFCDHILPLANVWMSDAKVAENISVWRSPFLGMDADSTSFLMSGMKPMSSILLKAFHIRIP